MAKFPCLLLNTLKVWILPDLSSTTSKMLFRLSLFITSSSLRMIPVRTPCGNYSNTPKYLNLLNMCNSATVVFNHSSLVYNFEVSASLRTPCMSPVLDLHFYQNENNGIPPKLFRDELWTLVNAHLVDVFTALIAGTLAQEEKQLKLIPLLSLSLSDFRHLTWNHTYIS